MTSSPFAAFKRLCALLFLSLLAVNSGPGASAESPFFHGNLCARELLQKHGSVMLLIEPATGRILDANEAALRFYGYPGLVGKNIKEINQLSPEKVQEEMEKARRRNQNYFSFRHRLANGAIRDVEVYSYPVTLQEKNLLFSIVVDVTERVLAEQDVRRKEKQIRALISAALLIQLFLMLLLVASRRKRREMEERLRAILDHSPLLVSEMDFSGRYLLCNEKTALFFRKSPQALLGKSFHELLPKAMADRFMGRIRRILQEKKPLFVEDRIPTDEGEKTYETVLFPLLNPQGEIRSVAGISHDVTELRQSREEKARLQGQLMEAQRMEAIGILAGGIAHDFNNILFPIMGYAEMLLAEIPEDHPQHKKVAEIHRASLRARDLTGQILTFARKECHAPGPLRMQSIIKEVVRFVRATIPSAIAIRPFIENECRSVNADPTHIHQIVMNLVTNAYHAMETTGGEIRIQLKEVRIDRPEHIHPDMPAGNYARLSVSDTGPGIPEALREKIFEPFFTTKPRGKGTGMGLAVVRGIVQGCGGFIQMESEEGKGACFHVYFPLITDAAAQTPPPPSPPMSGEGEHILLVDDERAIVTLQETILESMGYRVTACTESAEALELFRKTPEKFDLVLTDMHMPGMSGDRLAEALHAIRPGTPLILCTGFSGHLTGEKPLPGGVRAFLAKPVTAGDLAAKIREVLDAQKNPEPKK